jgi:hypothetical protein
MDALRDGAFDEIRQKALTRLRSLIDAWLEMHASHRRRITSQVGRRMRFEPRRLPLTQRFATIEANACNSRSTASERNHE